MTPKEKAEQLIQTYVDAMFYPDVARLAALIAVDEIINSNPTSQLSDPFLGNRTYENVNYWKDVKQEIQQL
jgi:hypothetical protein